MAEPLWQIFIDARAYFSATGPALSQSQLYQLRGFIQSCTLRATINCPVDRLLGRQSRSRLWYPNSPVKNKFPDKIYQSCKMPTNGNAGSKRFEIIGAIQGRPKGRQYSVKDAERMVRALLMGVRCVSFWQRFRCFVHSCLQGSQSKLSMNVL